MKGDYPLGADNKYAPWNNLDDMHCPCCGTKMETTDSGKYRGKEWFTFKCPECKYIYSEEPDYE